jgi:hypothetical protein
MATAAVAKPLRALAVLFLAVALLANEWLLRRCAGHG